MEPLLVACLVGSWDGKMVLWWVSESVQVTVLAWVPELVTHLDTQKVSQSVNACSIERMISISQS